MFDRYIGIDYSGANTPTTRLTGLRVYMANSKDQPTVVDSPYPRATRWTRKEVAEWLVEILREEPLSIIGIDHGFSFPHIYFTTFKVSTNWPEFTNDFCAHWPTDQDNVRVRDVKDGQVGRGIDRLGEPTWKRITEMRCGARGVFIFPGQGTVAFSTHSGIPWLRYIREEVGDRVHFWPFDGWKIPRGKSTLVEAYPSLYNDKYEIKEPSEHHHDAYSVAAWMREADLNGTLEKYFNPSDLSPEKKKMAKIEGWIIGVGFKAQAKD